MWEKEERKKETLMPGKHRKHTEITSEAQRGLFGAELARRKAGKQGRMKGITTEELRSHLKESGGKDLPAVASHHYASDEGEKQRTDFHKKKRKKT